MICQGAQIIDGMLILVLVDNELLNGTINWGSQDCRWQTRTLIAFCIVNSRYASKDAPPIVWVALTAAGLSHAVIQPQSEGTRSA